MSQQMGGLYYKAIIIGGDTSYISMKGAPLPCAITANPKDGDSLAISYSCDNGDNYTAWSAGTVTSFATVTFTTPITHIKVVCTGTGVASTISIC